MSFALRSSYAMAASWISKRRRLIATGLAGWLGAASGVFLVMSQLALPSSSAISDSRGWSSSTARTTIGLPPTDVSQHAGQVEDHLEVPDRGQRVALEPALARDREVVEAQGEVGKVAEECEADVPPLDAGVQASVHLELRALGDPVAEEQRQDDEEREQEDDQAPDDGQDSSRSFHGSPPAGGGRYHP